MFTLTARCWSRADGFLCEPVLLALTLVNLHMQHRGKCWQEEADIAIMTINIRQNFRSGADADCTDFASACASPASYASTCSTGT